MHVLTGVSEAANRVNAQVSVSTNLDATNGMVAYERVMRSGSADGAIVTSASVHDENIARLVASGIPVVLLGRYPHLADAVSVGVDDDSAGFAATEHLILVHGRRSLLHLSGPLDHQTSIDRRDGPMRAATKPGVSYTVIEGDYSEDCAGDVTSRINDLDLFDGIFTANDEMAFGAVSILQARGYSVPTQMSIVGFGDFGLSRVTSPSITTMHVPVERMARLATERLFDLLAGERVRGVDAPTVLPVELVPRQSCRCEAL